MCCPCFGVVCFLIAGPQRWKGCYSIRYRQGETTLNFYFFYLCCCRFFATRCFASVFSCSCAGPFRIIADLIRYALYNYLASICICYLFFSGELTKLERSIIGALITLDVHARDMITEMVRVQVDDVSSFEWQKQLRYYWDITMDNCVVKMSNSIYIYGYEYLGASPRLVITPLTVRLSLDMLDSCTSRKISIC